MHTIGIMAARMFTRIETPIQKRPGRREINMSAHRKILGFRQGCFRKENYFLNPKLTTPSSRTEVLHHQFGDEKVNRSRYNITLT